MAAARSQGSMTAARTPSSRKDSNAKVTLPFMGQPAYRRRNERKTAESVGSGGISLCGRRDGARRCLRCGIRPPSVAGSAAVIQHLRRLGLTPEGPGKGKTIAYDGEDVDKWLLALELAHFQIDPVMAMSHGSRKGGTGAQRRFAKSLRRRERASARQTTSSSSSLSPPCRKSRPWAACGFGGLAR